MRDLAQVLSPNRTVSQGTVRLLVGLEALLLLTFWAYGTPPIVPKPFEVLHSLGYLWSKGLGQQMYVSFMLNAEAILLATGLSLLLAYATVLPAFRPIASAVSKLRFLGLTGLTFVFTMMVTGSHLKVSILVFGISVFMLTDMARVVADAPKEKFDLARTPRMGEWRVVWEVVVLGQKDKVFNVVRTSAAIGWVMLTMVEGLVRSEGGIGTLLLVQSKYFRLADVFAIQLVILLVGLTQDYIIGVTRRLTCPYADLTLERS